MLDCRRYGGASCTEKNIAMSLFLHLKVMVYRVYGQSVWPRDIINQTIHSTLHVHFLYCMVLLSKALCPKSLGSTWSHMHISHVISDSLIFFFYWPIPTSSHQNKTTTNQTSHPDVARYSIRSRVHPARIRSSFLDPVSFLTVSRRHAHLQW